MSKELKAVWVHPVTHRKLKEVCLKRGETMDQTVMSLIFDQFPEAEKEKIVNSGEGRRLSKKESKFKTRTWNHKKNTG